MNLRQQVLKGGAYLVVRQAMGLGISLGGVIALTRLIGPTNYGLYTGALAIVLFLTNAADFGIDVYLVRRKEDLNDDVYHQAFTVLLLGGIIVATLAFLGVPFLLGRWFGDPRFVDPVRALLPTIPLSLSSIPVISRLERDLNYRSVALVELSGQGTYCAASLVFALAGWGVWAPIIGYWSWQGALVATGYASTRFRPRLVWSRLLLREMLGYGLGYTASVSVWQLRSLVNPLVVGRFLGPAAVGYVSLAIRCADVLSFVKSATWRLSIAALGKVQGNHVRLRRGMEEAMSLQLLAVGPVLAGFALVAPWLLPLVFGRRWDPVLDVYPFIALGYIVNAVFNMHSSVLYVLQRNRAVTLFHAAHIALFAASALLLVPRFGVAGYGLAELAALPAYAVVHAQVRKLFTFTYAGAVPWLVGLVPPLFAVFVPTPWAASLWLPLVAVAVWPPQRHQLGEYVRALKWKPA